jgi:general stress protein YciG
MSRQEAGRKGASARDTQNRSDAAKKAMETREKRNPQELHAARSKGGQHSHGGGRPSK